MKGEIGYDNETCGEHGKGEGHVIIKEILDEKSIERKMRIICRGNVGAWLFTWLP